MGGSSFPCRLHLCDLLRGAMGPAEPRLPSTEIEIITPGLSLSLSLPPTNPAQSRRAWFLPGFVFAPWIRGGERGRLGARSGCSAGEPQWRAAIWGFWSALARPDRPQRFRGEHSVGQQGVLL